ncbi:GNAT family acetyltransferase [Azospirillum thermophilum]|uniref:GNAT family acetyltransferase n=1 Tax=Azospirillum thermophilum TaxID=2202148 RepID=A0A2S2CRU3_9PROT|nr:GNAT family acetyltransferase [Azospirillum thermophilum]
MSGGSVEGGSVERGLAVRAFRPEDRDALIALWTAGGLTVPWNDPVSDIALAMSRPNSTILVGTEDGRPVASVMVGYDGHRGWFYYLAVDAACRRRGHGRRMVEAAEAWLTEAGMPKAMLMVRDSNHAVLAFYERLGYARSDTIVMQKWLKTS